MSFYAIIFIITIILFVISVTRYFYKTHELKVALSKKVIVDYLIKSVYVCLFIALIIIFCFNIPIFPTEMPEIVDIIIVNISILILVVSVMLFTSSFTSKNKSDIILEFPSRKKGRIGTIKLGQIFNAGKRKHAFFLDIEDLAQHMFVCGTTGTGKSNFLQQFLLDFTKQYEIPFLLTEFKGEYHFLQKKIDDLLILKPGENFSINIFDPEGGDPAIHAERVFKIFESGGMLENIDYSPQMERVFVDILNEICPKEENRNWEKFFSVFDEYYAQQSDFTMKKTVDAIRNRIRRYSISTLKNIFEKKSGLNVKELFNHRVLLDLSSIIRKGGEKEDALFFLNMVLKYLWDRNIEKGSKNYEGITHITIIEDAQYFAPQELSSRTKLTSYIEDIALLLRGTGECLITLATRPNISREILANCGVLVSFQVHMQKNLMQELLNLKEHEKEFLSMLKKGQCIVRINSHEKPFALATQYLSRSWLSDDEIVKNNKEILGRKNNLSKAKIEVKSYCKFCGKEIKHTADNYEGCSTRKEEKYKEKEEFEKFIDKLVKLECGN